MQTPRILTIECEPISGKTIKELVNLGKSEIKSKLLINQVLFNLSKLLESDTIVCDLNHNFVLEIFLLVLSKPKIYFTNKKTYKEFVSLNENLDKKIKPHQLKTNYPYQNGLGELQKKLYIINYLDLQYASNLFEEFINTDVPQELIIFNIYYSPIRSFIEFLDSFSEYFATELYPVNYGFALITKKSQIPVEYKKIIMDNWQGVNNDYFCDPVNINKTLKKYTVRDDKLVESESNFQSMILDCIKICFGLLRGIEKNIQNHLDIERFNLPNDEDYQSLNYDRELDFINLLKSIFKVDNLAFKVILAPERLQCLNEYIKEYDFLLKASNDNSSIMNYSKKLSVLRDIINAISEVKEISFWLKYWRVKDNNTWKLLVNNEELAGQLLPKPVKSENEYTNFYVIQSWSNAYKHLNPKNKQVEQKNDDRKSIVFYSSYNGSVGHLFRHSNAISVLESIYRVLRFQYPNKTLRWLDIGCATGVMTCSTRVIEIGGSNCLVYGIDVNASSISMANAKNVSNRRYYQVQPFSLPEEIKEYKFNIVTAFELLEHIFDPVKFVEFYGQLCSDYFVAGSPLEEIQRYKPNQAHVWSFNRKGYSSIFEKCGMNVTYSAEARIGDYIGGHDWLTLVASKNRVFPRSLA